MCGLWSYALTRAWAYAQFFLRHTSLMVSDAEVCCTAVATATHQPKQPQSVNASIQHLKLGTWSIGHCITGTEKPEALDPKYYLKTLIFVLKGPSEGSRHRGSRNMLQMPTLKPEREPPICFVICRHMGYIMSGRGPFLEQGPLFDCELLWQDWGKNILNAVWVGG